MTADRPHTYHLFGNLVTFLAFPSETGGRCAICEIRVAPGAGAPPNHHAGEDESFYILGGTFEFMVNGDVRQVGAGDFIKVPDGGLHAFTCTGAEPGRLLSITAPGQVHDDFFTKVGEAVPDGTTEFPPADGPPDIAHVVAVAAAAGMTIVAPEGAPA